MASTDTGNPDVSTQLPSGVIAAIVTPLTGQGEPDTDRFVQHARWLLSHGCDGLNVLGTTGEATSFSLAQRKAFMSQVAAVLDGDRMMVGTGCPDLASTIELTRHAFAEGYAAALILPPYYFKGVSDEGLRAYFDAVVKATSDTPIPILLYNFPQMTGVRFEPALVARLAKEHGSRIVGAKDSSGDLDYAAQLAAIDGFAVYPSDEASLAVARTKGFAGCISATANISAPIAAKLWQNPEDAAVLGHVRETRAAITAVPLVAAVKHLAARLHDDPGFAAVMPPLSPLTSEQADKLPELAPIIDA